MSWKKPIFVASGPGIVMLRDRWLHALAQWSGIQNEETTNALKHAERDYVFAWRRARHRMIWGTKAFPTRERKRTT